MGPFSVSWTLPAIVQQRSHPGEPVRCVGDVQQAEPLDLLHRSTVVFEK